MAAEGIEQSWMRERDDNEQQAREELQTLAASLVGDYKVSFPRAGVTRWVGGWVAGGRKVASGQALGPQKLVTSLG